MMSWLSKIISYFTGVKEEPGTESGEWNTSPQLPIPAATNEGEKQCATLQSEKLLGSATLDKWMVEEFKNITNGPAPSTVRESARKQPRARKIRKLDPKGKQSEVVEVSSCNALSCSTVPLNISDDLLSKVASPDKPSLSSKPSLSVAQDQEKCQLLSSIEALKCELKAKNELISKQERCKETVGVVSSMREEFTCVICQELFIGAHTLPCSHSFCEYCIKEWIKKRNVCPVCRKYNKSGAVYSLALDNAVATIVSKLSAAEKRERESRKEEYKAKLESAAVEDSDRFSDSSTGTISDYDSDDYESDDYDSDDSDDYDDNSDDYDDDSLSGDSFTDNSMTDEDDYNYDNHNYGYYGGYGRCFNCGERGHWQAQCSHF